MAEIVGLITARGGSKGIPRKNVLSLAGKPLLAWTALAAQASRLLGRTLLSTDDEEIAATGRSWGIEIPFMRPAALALDDTPHLAVVEHALDWLEESTGRLPDYIVLLQPTSPLRSAADIDGTVQLALDRAAPAVVSVCPAAHHPYLCKRIDPSGVMAPFVESNLPYLRRQDLPAAFALNGAVYAVRPAVLRRERTFQPAGTLAYVMPPERSLDVDTAWDWHLAELVLRDQNADVKL